MTISRRALLRAAGAAGASMTVAYPFGQRWASAQNSALPLGISIDACGVFTLGVASFDPSSDGVILWTRVAPEPLLPDGHGGTIPDAVEVAWAVATDAGMSDIVQTGTVATSGARHHTVRVDVSGLEPGTTYWYAFRAGDDFSVIGRTRTAPLPGDPRPIKLAWVGCSKFHTGFFTPYDHLVAEDNIDLVLCTGDYIYEEAFEPSASSDFRVEDRPEETLTLDDYRARYTLYRLDTKKRRAHQMYPWVVTWDDHEVDNNYADLTPEEGTKHPDLSLTVRRADAYLAHYEYLPGRVEAPPDGPDYLIYRTMQYGQIDLIITDTRQYRDDQPCGDEATRDNPTGLPLAFCSGFTDDTATILGSDQRDWLLQELSASTANWRVMLNAVMVGALRIASLPDDLAAVIDPLGDAIDVADGFYVNPDQWDGYPNDRRVMLQHLYDESIPDTVVLTGDIHSNWVNDLVIDADDPTSPVVGTEFVGTSITSSGFSSEEEALFRTGLYPTSNQIRYLEGAQRGYSTAVITPESWITTQVAVSTITHETSTSSVLGTWQVLRGQAGADPIDAPGANPAPRIRLDR